MKFNDRESLLHSIGLSDRAVKLFLNSEEHPAEEDSTVYIYDVIGEDIFGEGVSGKTIAAQLESLGKRDSITVKINSPGGSIFEGMAIYNALKDHPATINVEVTGNAASAASFIAMAGDSISIHESATMMIHRGYGVVIGNYDEMNKMGQILEKIDGQIAGVYASRAGRRKETFLKMMDEETWFTGQEAVDAKLATKLIPNKNAAANSSEEKPTGIYAAGNASGDGLTIVAPEGEESLPPVVDHPTSANIESRLRVLDLDEEEAA